MTGTNKATIKQIFLVILMLMPAACSVPNIFVAAPPAPVDVVDKPVLYEPPIDATATSTPFLPLPITPTYLPTDLPTAVPTEAFTPTPTIPSTITKSWEDYPGPTVWPDIAIPAPMGILPQPEGQVNILLLGSDQRRNEGGFRTDTILLLTLNPKQGTANMTSFPRDLYVYIPGWTVQRINTAFPRDGFELMATTMEYNFGVRPDYYVLINFWSFEEVIDSLGGVTVQVGVPLTDHRDGRGNYSVPSGPVYMDGETALWYVRSRYTSSDFERGRRQQEVVQAIFIKMLSLNAVARAPELFDIYRRNVTTNLTLDAVSSLLPLASLLNDNSRIEHFFISRAEVTPWRATNGAQVLLPNREAVLEVMRKALNSP